MKVLASARATLVVTALCAGLLAALASPAAAAEPTRYLYMSASAQCDAAAGRWVITWSVTNAGDVAGTVGNVRVTPAGYAVASLDPVIEAGATETGVQYIPATTHDASLTVDVNWHDGPVTYNIYRPAYIKNSCQAQPV
jgi:hypothetical protein